MASELSELRAELWRTRDDLERMKSSSNSRTPTKTASTPPRPHPSPRVFDRRRQHRGQRIVGHNAPAVDGSNDRYGQKYSWHAGNDPRGRYFGAGGAATAASGTDGGGMKGTEPDSRTRRGRSGGVESGPTSPPTSRESALGSDTNSANAAVSVTAGERSRRRRTGGGGDTVRYSSSPGVGGEAEATLSDLKLEGMEFKNWTEEASSIAVRLIEEVKGLRWERDAWRADQATAARAFAELRAHADALEQRLLDAESENKQSRDALAHAQRAEREQSRAADRAEAELRVAREQAENAADRAKVELRAAHEQAAAAADRAKAQLRATREQAAAAADKSKAELRAAREQAYVQEFGLGAGLVPGGASVPAAVALREQLRREKEGADALQRRLDAARAKLSGYEREQKEWRVWKTRLEEMRRSWGKQLKKVAKKMRDMSKENTALKVQLAEAERARDRADAEALRHRDDLRRLTEQRDNLLLGAMRTGHAASPADALAELLAAAAAGVATGARSNTRNSSRTGAVNANLGSDGGTNGINRGLKLGGAWDELFPEEGGVGSGGEYDSGRRPPGRESGGDGDGGGGRGRRLGVSAEDLKRARAEAKLARVAVQQERLKREGAIREKDEAVRQLHRLMGAARRAVGRRDNKLRSSRLETEVVWNALQEAVREE